MCVARSRSTTKCNQWQQKRPSIATSIPIRRRGSNPVIQSGAKRTKRLMGEIHKGGTESDAPLLGGRAGRRSALDFKLTYSALEFLFQVRMQAFSLYLAWSNLLIQADQRLKTDPRHRSSSSFSPSLSESYRMLPVFYNESILATLSIDIACPSHPTNNTTTPSSLVFTYSFVWIDRHGRKIFYSLAYAYFFLKISFPFFCNIGKTRTSFQDWLTEITLRLQQELAGRELTLTATESHQRDRWFSLVSSLETLFFVA